MATPQMIVARTSTVNRVKTLINNELKEICRAEGLPVSGVKASLQDRIIKHIDEQIQKGDHEKFETIRHRVMHRGESPPRPSSYAQPTAPRASLYGHASNGLMAHAYNRPSLPPPPGQRAPSSSSRLSFKQSPFYHVLEPLSPVTDLTEMPSNRHTVHMQIALSDDVTVKLKSDPSLRVMLYCTSATLMSQYDSLHDINFPGQVEVKLNQEEVKSNYKGLKNKPGTTKPADLTPYMRKAARYANSLQINYALTTRKYSVVVNLVRKSSAEELTEKIRKGRVISKERVIQEMISKAKDPDIVAMSSVMSLKDPISTMRMTIPCRSTICNHNQCFDASYFIQLQEQAPTWTCPICAKTISYEALAVDHYVSDILQKTTSSVEQVTIEPEGQWSEVKQREEDNVGKSQSRAPYDNDSDDDLVEISDPGGDAGVPIKRDPGLPSPGIAQHTPPLSSREASAPQSARANGGGSKRPSAVIDLTLSDDDDEPPRPAKRQSNAGSGSGAVNYHTPISLPDRPQDIHQHHQHQLYNQQHPLPARPPPPPGMYRSYTPQMNSPQTPASATPSQSGGAQQLPWPASYATYDSPWRNNNHQNSW